MELNRVLTKIVIFNKTQRVGYILTGSVHMTGNTILTHFGEDRSRRYCGELDTHVEDSVIALSCDVVPRFRQSVQVSRISTGSRQSSGVLS